MEAVVRSISPQVLGKEILQFICSGDAVPKVEHLQVKGKVIENIARYGKYIIFHLGDGYLISHLRMTGQWAFHENLPSMNHFRWGFSLMDGPAFHGYLWFTDIRKFGTLDYTEDYKSYPPLKLLGIDGVYLNQPKAQASIETRLAKTSRPIKNVLLDQSLIAGCGNIYASEILWKLKIHPETPAKNLVGRTKEMCDNLYQMLQEAIADGGSSVSDYKGGKYQEKHKVYARTGSPCFRCKTPITRFAQSGRATFYCANCQIL